MIEGIYVRSRYLERDKKNLKIVKKLVEKFEEQYRKVGRLQKFKPKSIEQEESKDFHREELLGKYTTKLLYG